MRLDEGALVSLAAGDGVRVPGEAGDVGDAPVAEIDQVARRLVAALGVLDAHASELEALDAAPDGHDGEPAREHQGACRRGCVRPSG